jgi:murein tripeptide amidase MpaA
MGFDYRFDHYFDYEEMTHILLDCAKRYPQLLELSSLCRTQKGRELWAASLSNRETGDFARKPACYIDANQHAGEVTGSMAAMHVLLSLLCRYGDDPGVTTLLDTTTFYILPRVSPDGAEVYLTSPDRPRSVDRPYPWDFSPKGLQPKDMDNDGVIRAMRIPSTLGTWKPSDSDPRILSKRQPGESGGTYYLVFPEGELPEYDQTDIVTAPDKWGLDFNRNYPYCWTPESKQAGAGFYPLSNAECKAVADFVLSHPNIALALTLHSSAGAILYPPGTKASCEAPKRDMRMFREMGAVATMLTGYPCLNVFDGFLPDKTVPASGAFDDWLYGHRGIVVFTMELWDIQKRAGILGNWLCNSPKSDYQREEDAKKLVDWIDANQGHDAVMEWTAFEHPQLGVVELGGFDFKFTLQNCPPAFLLQEAEKVTRLVLRLARVMPRLCIRSFSSTAVGKGVFRIEALIENDGYLPTFLTRQALEMKADSEVIAQLSFAGEMLMGEKSMKIGHLDGYSAYETGYGYEGIETKSELPLKKKLVWVIAADSGAQVRLALRSALAGSAEDTLLI